VEWEEQSICVWLWGVSRPRPPSGFLTHRTQHMVILIAILHYSKRIQSKISKGEKCIGQNTEEMRHKLIQIVPQWSHTGCNLWQYTGTTHVKCLSRMLITNSVPKVLIGGWSYRYSLKCTKFQSLQIKAGVQQEWHSLYPAGTVRRSPIQESVILTEENVCYSSSQMPPMPNLASRPFSE